MGSSISASAAKPKSETKLFGMKEACELTGMTYENLKFYCNEGLVPNVKRTASNRRVFDQHDINWINSLGCLRRCGMSIAEMREYLELCLKGPSSIDERRIMLAAKRDALVQQLQEVQESIDYIDWKQGFYDDVQAGRIEYRSDLISPQS